MHKHDLYFKKLQNKIKGKLLGNLYNVGHRIIISYVKDVFANWYEKNSLWKNMESEYERAFHQGTIQSVINIESFNVLKQQ